MWASRTRSPFKATGLGLLPSSGIGLVVIGEGSARLLALAATPVITSLFHPQAFGTAALVISTTSLATMVCLSGLDVGYMRHHAIDVPADSERNRDVERFIWRRASSLALVFGPTTLALVLLLPPLGASAELGLAAMCIVFAGVASALGKVRRRVRSSFLHLAAATFLGAVVSTGLSVLFGILWRQDAAALLWASAAGAGTAVAVLGVPWASLFCRPSLSQEQRREIWQVSLPMLATAPSSLLIASLDRWALELFVSTTAVGIYSFSATVAMIGAFVNAAAANVWFPEATRLHSAGDGRDAIARGLGGLVGAYMIVFAAIATSGGDIVRALANERFHPGATCIPLVALGVCFSGIAGAGATGCFLAKRLRPLVTCWALGAAVGVALHAGLVSTLGIVGAGAAQAMTLALVAGGVMWSSQAAMRLPIPWGRLGVVAAITAFFVVLATPSWSASPGMSLALKLPCGILYAAIAARILLRTPLRLAFFAH